MKGRGPPACVRGPAVILVLLRCSSSDGLGIIGRSDFAIPELPLGCAWSELLDQSDDVFKRSGFAHKEVAR